jgi:hypothetical protein
MKAMEGCDWTYNGVCFTLALDIRSRCNNKYKFENIIKAELY